MTFKDRFDAGQQLVSLLKEYAHKPDTIIIAIPRGGLQIGYVLAKELHLPLDVMFIKKIGAPGNKEYAIGAVSLTHEIVNKEYANNPELKSYIEQQVVAIRSLLQEREHRYRGDKKPLALHDKTVIVVDDGVATGQTLLAALELIKQDHPKEIVVALPVCPQNTLNLLQSHADTVICAMVPHLFFGVGQFYDNFEQVDDQEAINLLHKAAQ